VFIVTASQLLVYPDYQMAEKSLDKHKELTDEPLGPWFGIWKD
jgi:hypothetical protein